MSVIDKVKEFFGVMVYPVGRDKYFHFLAGAFITGVIAFFAPLFVAQFTTFVVAFAKELYDMRTKRSVQCMDDAIYTLAGGFVASLPPTLGFMLWG